MPSPRLVGPCRRYALPKALQEYKVVCAGADKPLVAAALLQQLAGQATLVFTASVEATRRRVCAGRPMPVQPSSPQSSRTAASLHAVRPGYGAVRHDTTHGGFERGSSTLHVHAGCNGARWHEIQVFEWSLARARRLYVLLSAVPSLRGCVAELSSLNSAAERAAALAAFRQPDGQVAPLIARPS